jgi:hypothetical protein
MAKFLKYDKIQDGLNSLMSEIKDYVVNGIIMPNIKGGG